MNRFLTSSSTSIVELARFPFERFFDGGFACKVSLSVEAEEEGGREGSGRGTPRRIVGPGATSIPAKTTDMKQKKSVTKASRKNWNYRTKRSSPLISHNLWHSPISGWRNQGEQPKYGIPRWTPRTSEALEDVTSSSCFLSDGRADTDSSKSPNDRARSWIPASE